MYAMNLTSEIEIKSEEIVEPEPLPTVNEVFLISVLDDVPESASKKSQTPAQARRAQKDRERHAKNRAQRRLNNPISKKDQLATVTKITKEKFHIAIPKQKQQITLNRAVNHSQLFQANKTTHETTINQKKETEGEITIKVEEITIENETIQNPLEYVKNDTQLSQRVENGTLKNNLGRRKRGIVEHSESGTKPQNLSLKIKLAPEEYEQHKARIRELKKKRRENETLEQKQLRREKDRLRMAKKRQQGETEEQKQARLEKQKLRDKNKYENETPEQREKRLTYYKERVKNETFMQRNIRLEKAKINYRNRELTPESYEKSLEYKREYSRNMRKMESEEERLKRLEKIKANYHKKMEQRKPQEHLRFLEEKRKKYNKRKEKTKLLSETLEEREARLARTRAKVKEKGNPRMETQEERELRLVDLKLIDEVMGIKTKPKSEEVPIKFEGGSSNDEDDPLSDLLNATENSNFTAKIPPQNPSHAFKCSKCVRTFEFRSSLIVHELEHRPKVKCKVCRQNVFAENLEEHQKIHQKAKKLPCDFCDETFSDETSLATHKIHHEVKKEIIEENEELITAGPTILSLTFHCDNCDQKFRQKFQLLEHIFRDHCGESKRNCLKCGFTTHCSNLMRIHRRSHKTTVDCDICGLDFTMTRFLEFHRYKVHNVMNYSCEFCGKAFGLRGTLRNHQHWSHASLLQPIPKKVPISYSCDLCPRVYQSKSYLLQHIERLHLNKNQYVCKHCNFTTNCQKMYQSHRLKCKKAHCNICRKNFQSNPVLLRHIEAIHENKLKYECEICGMKVKVKKYLYHHKRLHHGDQPDNMKYNCEFCGKHYKVKNQFAAHVKNQHHIQNYVITPEMLIKVESDVRVNKKRGI